MLHRAKSGLTYMLVRLYSIYIFLMRLKREKQFQSRTLLSTSSLKPASTVCSVIASGTVCCL